MAGLLNELWHSIFNHLELADLCSCARVSKRLYFFVKEYRIRELAFTHLSRVWFHDCPIKYKHRAPYWQSCILERTSLNLEQLKRLKIGYLVSSSKYDLNLISQFKQLEELDIDLKNYDHKKCRTLSLDKLKVLYVFNGARSVVLQTPQLTNLYTFNLGGLDITYPESIRCIHTFSQDGKLSLFTNLEYLTFTDHYNQLYYSLVDDSKPFELFDPAELKKLKEIDFYYHAYDYVNGYNFGFYPEFVEENIGVFRVLIEQILERSGVKVFWMNVQITDTSLLTEYLNLSDTERNFVILQFQHYEQLKGRLDFFHLYHYNWSTPSLKEAGFELSSEEFMRKFLAKYCLRTIVVADRVEESELLMTLIARSPSLLCLRFGSSGLEQRFFDRLPEIVRRNSIPLKYLGFWKPFEDTPSDQPNLEFALRLPHLEWLEASDQYLPADLVSSLLELPSIAEINFRFCGNQILVRRVSVHRTHLNCLPPIGQQKLLKFFAILDVIHNLPFRFIFRTLRWFLRSDYFLIIPCLTISSFWCLFGEPTRRLVKA